MDRPAIVSRPEWLIARKELLIKEKQATRQRDALSLERRSLPMVEIEKEYVFGGPQGPARLIDLFERQPQLIVYHFMFDPSWDEGCKSCSYFIDNVAGSLVHLRARETAFAVISRAPLTKLESFKKRMEWTFPWYSSIDNDFNYDFHVTLDEDAGSLEYNYENVATLKAAGKVWMDELPGLSVFLRDGSRVYHTYSTYQRGLDILIGIYNYLDLTPFGRHEEELAWTMEWVRHHDKYRA